MALLYMNRSQANIESAQGAAQATEDAASIAACLRTYNSVAEALREYERVRKPRTTYIARNRRILQEWLHVYDGPAKDERDRAMANDDERNPIYWGWKVRKDWLFRYDASDLNEEESIPTLPPMPKDHQRVYRDDRAQLRSEHRL